MSMSARTASSTPSLTRFTRMAETVSQSVIRAYSTSFGLATRLLGRRHRTHVRNIYALVRVADEIVDGVASEAGLSGADQRAVLDAYVVETHRAMQTGYSSDLVIHAFAATARAAGIDETLTRPFFDSMRTDLLNAGTENTVFDPRAHAAYVHGSAEVVGLMCLRVFLRGQEVTESTRTRLEHGARQLGAAFQNVNFLRDLADDTERLGRSYLGNDRRLSDAEVLAWVVRIRGQLADAKAVIPLLPRDARAAVRSAHALFGNLTDRIARTPAEQLYEKRIRVPDAIKTVLVARAIFMTVKERDR